MILQQLNLTIHVELHLKPKHPIQNKSQFMTNLIDCQRSANQMFYFLWSSKYNQMLQEGKSLQHTKVYLSNRNLRVCTFQDEVQRNPHQAGSKLSLIATNNNSVSQQQTPNLLIGDADTFFLLRENEKYEQQINELIDEIQTKNMKQSEKSTQNQILKQDLDELRIQNNKNLSLVNLLRKISKQIIKALKIKSKMSLKMANMIKKLEDSLQNMSRELLTATSSKHQIQQKYAQLQKQIKINQQMIRNRIQSQIQTESIYYQHFAIQVEKEPKSQHSKTIQSQQVINHQQSTQFFVINHSQETNTIKVQIKNSSCSTQRVAYRQQNLQFGASLNSLFQRSQQTNLQLSQMGTQCQQKHQFQAEVQYQVLQQNLQTQSIETQAQTNKIETISTYSITQVTPCQQKNIQTLKLNNLKLERNLISYTINLQQFKQKFNQTLPKRQLNIVQKISIRIQQGCQNTLQTEVTEQDDHNFKINFTDKEVNQNILVYFKQINSKNQISYNEQIVKDLEQKGQSQASKAFARLMKQHMCLKLCLNRLMQNQGEQLQSQNQKNIEVFEQSIQNVQKSSSLKGNKQKEQCIIY